MNTFFAPVDTLDASTFLRAVAQPNSNQVERFLMPVTGLSDNGQPVTPKGVGSAYNLFLTMDATIANGSFIGMDVTLWADPNANDGTPSVSSSSDPSFSNGITHDIVLATGTMVSGAVMPPDATGTRHADFVQTLTPTLAGDLLLHGSIQPGKQIEENLTTPSTAFSTSTDSAGVVTNVVDGGSATISLTNGDSFLLPQISGNPLMRFIHL
jgi:hypothetical protein